MRRARERQQRAILLSRVPEAGAEEEVLVGCVEPHSMQTKRAVYMPWKMLSCTIWAVRAEARVLWATLPDTGKCLFDSFGTPCLAG